MTNVKRKVMASKKISKKHSSFVANKNLVSKTGTSGITLIALVITIIVLLILAGVSITTLTGENGILTKAQTAKTTNDRIQTEEEMKLVVLNWQLEKKTNREANLKEFLDKKVENGELDKVTDNEDESFTIERNGYEATISDEDGLGDIAKVEPELPLQLVNPGEKAKLTQKNNYKDSNNDTATIPEGFTVSKEDNIIDTGLVVIAPDGSEFVWVPVPYVVAKSEAEAINKDEDQIVGKAMAVKQNDGNYRGLLYNFTGLGNDTNSSVWPNCTMVTTSYREPDILQENDTNIDDLAEGITLESLQLEYKTMIKSVEKYKGFYVGRYETSLKEDKSNVTSKKGQIPMSAADDNEQMWYGMYEKQKNYAENITEKDMSNIIGSSMIWGSQYDAIMNWMLTSDTEKSKVTEESKATTDRTTGISDDIMNKIYDLKNNFYEWTLEVSNNHSRTLRGGYYNSTYSASNRRSNLPTTIGESYGSRLALYIK